MPPHTWLYLCTFNEHDIFGFVMLKGYYESNSEKRLKYVKQVSVSAARLVYTNSKAFKTRVERSQWSGACQ